MILIRWGWYSLSNEIFDSLKKSRSQQVHYYEIILQSVLKQLIYLMLDLQSIKLLFFFHATDSVSSALLFSLTLSCSGFSSISLSWSWSVVLSSWLICSVARVSASSSWLSFSSFCFCSLSFMRSSSSRRNSLIRPNSADTRSSRSPARSWNKGKTLVSRNRTLWKFWTLWSH